MKISVSLSVDEVRVVDELAATGRYPSRSAAVAAGIRALRDRDLEAEYAESAGEWVASDDAELWDTTVGDGIR